MAWCIGVIERESPIYQEKLLTPDMFFDTKFAITIFSVWVKIPTSMKDNREQTLNMKVPCH